MDDGKTRDFLGLPLFKPLYGFGDRLELRAKMTTALFAHGFDRRAVKGALPQHPRVALHPASPLAIVQADYPRCADVGDPQSNDYPYREVMLACFLEGAHGLLGPLWPLVLFLDDPIPLAAGREFHGFPKVPAEVALGEERATVDYRWSPRGERRTSRVLTTRWAKSPGLVARALNVARDAVVSAVRASGVDSDTVNLIAELALAPSGEVWNLHQVPDLASPRRATFSQLTSFKPLVLEPTFPRVVDRFVLELPRAADEPVWALGQRFFGAGQEAAERRATFAFAWEATMHISGGTVVDEWR